MFDIIHSLVYGARQQGCLSFVCNHKMVFLMWLLVPKGRGPLKFPLKKEDDASPDFTSTFINTELCSQHCSMNTGHMKMASIKAVTLSWEMLVLEDSISGKYEP